MILYLNDPYADTLLALGICAAYNVRPLRYTGSAYLFPDRGDTPILFPVNAEMDDPVPPATFHRFKASAVKSFGGAKLIEVLAAQWNPLLPEYHELSSLLDPGFDDFRATRFWHVSKPYSTSATFRPTASKDLLSGETGRDFWLFDALRAIGFLTFASPKRIDTEAQTCRWLVFTPTLPNPLFSELLTKAVAEIGLCYQLAASILGSELHIPRIECVQYAELNPLARTPFRLFSLEPRALPSDSCKELSDILYRLRLWSKSDQARMASQLIAYLEQQDLDAIASFMLAYVAPLMNQRGSFIPYPPTTHLLDSVLQAPRGVDVWQ